MGISKEGDSAKALMNAKTCHLCRGKDVFGPRSHRDELFSATMLSSSPALNLVNPHFLKMWIDWRQGT